LREQSGKAGADADRLQRELEQVRADAAQVRAELEGARRQISSLESAPAPQDDMPAGSYDQVATIERERDALSLALDTERMMSADLRAALTSAERRLAETTSEFDALRAQASRVGTEGLGLPADAIESLTELTFDEDNSGCHSRRRRDHDRGGGLGERSSVDALQLHGSHRRQGQWHGRRV
jgi:hypothetical protein